MQGDDRLFDYALRSIAAATDYQRLVAFLHELRDLYGVAHIAYHAAHVPAVDRRGTLVLLTYNPEWVQRYIHRDYFQIDPVEIAWQGTIAPVDWNEVNNTSPRARSFFREAECFNVGRQGLSIPIVGGALFTFTANVSEDDWPAFRRHRQAELGMVGQYLHHRVLELASPATRVVSKLSKRELQCVKLLSAGFAVKQIAGAMALSETTVRDYVRSACRKLHCVNARELVPKAIALELVDVTKLHSV
jgi:DNA-binding CsgD family transcriptional regulator